MVTDMTDRERAAMAEQLLANPLFHAIFDDMEATATNACIYADDDEQRASYAMRVRAIRTLREDCQAAIATDSNRRRKGAPA